jgi:hypothetical protein
MLDGGGCLGVHPSGEVASFLWDEPDLLRAEHDQRIINIAYFQASLKYPALAALVPLRPTDALACPFCDGSGKCLDPRANLVDLVVCYCGGLGWLPRESARRVVEE